MKLYQLCMIMIVLCLLGLLAGRFIWPQIKYEQQTKEILVDNLSVKVNELKGKLLSDLKQCESKGFNEDFGLISFDGNKNNKKVEIASIGSYQFKKATIIYYYDTLYQKDITGKEAILIALDDQKAGELARDIIFKTDKGLSNWFNCAKSINGQYKLQVIKELEQ